MKYTIAIGIAVVLLAGMVIGVPAKLQEPADTQPQAAIEWLTIEEAAARSAVDGKKILIDLYTDWCSWCKRLDADTYSNPEVIAYVTANFHAVKFDAEQHGDVVLQGRTFKHLPELGRNGTHELAARLMNGKLSYPTTVFLEPNLAMITPVPGYHGAKDMQVILSYVAQEAYKTTSFDQFKASAAGSR